MIKRGFDVLVSGAALVVLAIPFAVVMAILRVTGEGEVWYRQERVGRGGRTFRAMKFATMRAGSEALAAGAFTVRDDPRVLPVGRVLRKTKLNELPQLINVLRGEMSVVGWRPVVPSSFAGYPDHVRERIVDLRPGLTGIGSLIFRDEEALVTQASRAGKDPMACYREDIKPYKGELELWYLEHRSFWLDLEIIAATLWAVLRPHGSGFRRWFRDLPTPASPLIREHLGIPSKAER